MIPELTSASVGAGSTVSTSKVRRELILLVLAIAVKLGVWRGTWKVCLKVVSECDVLTMDEERELATAKAFICTTRRQEPQRYR